MSTTPDAETAGSMNIELTSEAVEFGKEAVRALRAVGGDDLVQQAEVQPEQRDQLVVPVLAELGAWELAPRRDADELEAAAALCRSVGYFAAPYPVAERLARPVDHAADGLVVVARDAPAAPLAGIGGNWLAVAMDGGRAQIVVDSSASVESVRDSAFVTSVQLHPLDDEGSGDLALALILPCWTLLGMLDRALELTSEHILVREQFGQSLGRFQSVQFQLTDAEVERRGVDVLARYALWSVQTSRDEAIDDALALRAAAVEAADIVFRIAHQLHGATGFCDETTLSWLSRYSLPLRRLPYGAIATQDLLTRRIGRRGLSGLFSESAGSV